MALILTRITALFKSIKNSVEYKNVLKNFSFLTVIQFSNYLLPLITLPYLVNVLGADLFGHLMFAQSFAQYFVIVVDYGFNFSATREIVLSKLDRKKISEVFYSVLLIKIIFFFLSLTALTIIVYSFDKFSEFRAIYFLSFASVLGNVLFPIWYFQGLERMGYVTVVNVSTRIASTILIFFLVNSPEDLLIVPAIYAVAIITPSIVVLFYVKRVFPIVFSWPSLYNLKYQLRQGWFIFLSSISGSLYSVSNTFLIGLLFNNTYAGYYAFAEKIIRACTSIYTPLNNALFPFMSAKMNQSPVEGIALLRKILVICVSITSLGAVVIYWGSDFLVYVIKPELYPSISVLKLLTPIMIFVAVNNLIGFQVLYTNGMDKQFLLSVFLAGLINVVLCIGLSKLFLYHAGGISLLASELFISGCFLFFSRKMLFKKWAEQL